MKRLIGKKIIDIFISNDQRILSFNTDQGQVNFIANSNCCSESWFADLLGIDSILNSTVIDVKEIYVNDMDEIQYVRDVYGYKINTYKGSADIIFRNNSNSYYGGWIDNYNKPLPDRMIQIFDDWSS